MKKIIKTVLLLLLVSALFLSFVACKTTARLSSATHALNNVSYSPNQKYVLESSFYDKLRKSSYHIYDLISEEAEGNGENFVASPLSIYMAFALLDYIGDEETKNEVSEFLDLSEEDILQAGELFKCVERVLEYGNKEICKVSLTNSIWMDKDQGYEYNQETLDSLASDFYCYGYESSFSKNNKKANDDIRKFIKNNTNGIIDRNFDLDERTLFALINTLYFKDNWLFEGDELDTESKKFYLDASDVLCEYLYGNYVSGIAVEDEIASTMYTETSHGYKLRFIVPKDGHTLKEAMDSDYLYNLTSMSHEAVEEDPYVSHATRTIFPIFNANGKVDVKSILMSKNMLGHTFSGHNTSLVNTQVYVSNILHDAVLKVDKKGVEGAAVTILLEGAKSAGPYETVYHDFLVDRPFGFILSTREGVVLFMGQITNPLK